MAKRHNSGFYCLIAKGLAAVLLLGTAAAHANPRYNNSLKLLSSGLENHIRIESPAKNGSAMSAGNSLHLSILGDENGGLGTAWRDAPMFATFAAPGIVSQSGLHNKMVLSISGNGNLFSAVQSGRSNQLAGAITGFGNAAAISQTGIGNTASFTQNGTGNALAISQSSW